MSGAITMRWERGNSPTLMGSNREGIVALESVFGVGVGSRRLVEERKLWEELQKLYRSVV